MLGDAIGRSFGQEMERAAAEATVARWSERERMGHLTAALAPFRAGALAARIDAAGKSARVPGPLRPEPDPCTLSRRERQDRILALYVMARRRAAAAHGEPDPFTPPEAA